MKVLYDNEGFIWRDEMKRLLVLTGMEESELSFAMEHSFDNVTFQEAVQIVNWFQANDYQVDPIKEFDLIKAIDMDQMLQKVISLNYSVVSHDAATGFVKTMTYDQGVPVEKFFKLVEENARIGAQQ